LLDAVIDDDVQKIVARLVEMAKSGSVVPENLESDARWRRQGMV